MPFGSREAGDPSVQPSLVTRPGTPGSESTREVLDSVWHLLTDSEPTDPASTAT